MSAATGTPATNGTITVTIPEQFSATAPHDAIASFDGPAISAPPDGQPVHSRIELYPATGSGWDGTFPDTDRRDAVRTYELDVEGADTAVMQFVSSRRPGKAGANSVDGPADAARGTATINVLVGSRLTQVVVITHPGREGLAVAAAVAKSITVAR